jgi:CheY-like chemotaxis protein
MVTMAQARILVVDDDTSIRSFVEMALDSVGYAVSTAGNGAQALEVTDQVHPDLILLDMRMPVMDGWTFARTYRQQAGPHAPIVVITAATDASAPQRSTPTATWASLSTWTSCWAWFRATRRTRKEKGEEGPCT